MHIKAFHFLAAAGFSALGADAFSLHSATHTIARTTPTTTINLSKNKRTVAEPKAFRLFSEVDASNDSVAPLESIELTDEKIAEMLEVTFIKACLQLGTGYVDVLKLFLASTKAAYDRGIEVPTLLQSVADCPINTANRDLTKEEMNLRSGWISISYLTLETIMRLEGGNEIKKLSVPDEIRESFGAIIEEKVKKNLGLLEGSVSSDDPTPSDPQAAALFAYNMKIVEMTIANVDEIKFATETKPAIDEDAVGPPRPNIPGTYKLEIK